MSEISELLLLGEHKLDAQEPIIPLPECAIVAECSDEIIDALNAIGCTSFIFTKDEIQKIIRDEDTDE